MLAVHAASKKFKVVVVVDKPDEKGKWHETFKVSFLSQLVWIPASFLAQFIIGQG